MTKNFFEVNNVDFNVGNKTKVKNVSFAIENQGDVICLLGPSGIGKTTIARIVAKSLNCLNSYKNFCKKDFCENCEAIANSSHIDVLEMDAASKTGVDDVRDLIEFSRIIIC